MQITRNSLETNRGPSDWFTGSVFLDTVAAPSDTSQVGAASVHFTPGARTAWHTHPHGQTIWVTEGVGLCAGGTSTCTEPGENLWHVAAPTRFMTHIAFQQADEQGNVVYWGRHVSDDEYAEAPSL